MTILLHRFLLKEPQRNYKWRVVIPDTVGDGSTAKNISKLGPVLMSSVIIPLPEIGVDAIHRSGGDVKLPGFVTVDTLTIEFYETADGEVTKALNDWKEIVRSPDGVYGLPRDFKKRILGQLTTGFNIVHTTFEMEGAFPIGGPPMTLDSGGNEGVTIAQTFAADRILVDDTELKLSNIFDNIVIPGVDIFQKFQPKDLLNVIT